MERYIRNLLIPLVVVAVLAAGAWAVVKDKPYRVSVALPTAPNVIKGGAVLIRGFEAGAISSISVVNGEAMVNLALKREFAPLHDGASVSVAWRAVLGERQLVVKDGPPTGATIPDGGMIVGSMPDPAEIDRVLSALDPKTRVRLSSLVGRLNSTLKGDESNVNATIQAAGPALGALGQVLQGLGDDGPAIGQLVHRTGDVIDILVNHESDVQSVVNQLSAAAKSTAAQRQQLDQALERLPGTLITAQKTLSTVPATVDRTIPLLDHLKPVTAQLPQFSQHLSPVLRDLRPAAAELRPTLSSLSELLDGMPALLDSAHSTFPGSSSLFKDTTPATTFLRPYTPELIGWMSNWGSAGANYDVSGHYMRSSINEGPTSVNVNPGVVPPGVEKDPHPLPGALEGQPWTDAYGSGTR